MFSGFSLDVLLLCHIARASQFMTELSVLVPEMASMMPIANSINQRNFLAVTPRL